MCTTFKGGQTAQFWHEWANFTTEKYILADVSGINIECIEIPIQHVLKGHKPNEPNIENIDKAVGTLFTKGIVSVTREQSGQVIPDIFLHPKKDGTHRLILNLKRFNETVEYHHFKMDSLRNIIQLMEPNCYMAASIDIKDAYYSFSIKPADRKFLCFTWKGILYDFSCLPNGLSSAPRKFTKIFKVPLTYLHKLGHISLGYLDDFYLQGQSDKKCLANVIFYYYYYVDI